MKRVLIFLTLGAMVAGPAAACDCLAPRANKWGGCAVTALPPHAVRVAGALWVIRNNGHFDRTNRVDAAGEAHWFAQWRGFLRRRCGSLDPVRNEKFNQPHIPGANIDEIDLIAFHMPPKNYPWN
ncbi:MAG: hypothetical protein ABIO86_07205 [Sphingomonas sp.]